MSDTKYAVVSPKHCAFVSSWLLAVHLLGCAGDDFHAGNPGALSSGSVRERSALSETELESCEVCSQVLADRRCLVREGESDYGHYDWIRDDSFQVAQERLVVTWTTPVSPATQRQIVAAVDLAYDGGATDESGQLPTYEQVFELVDYGRVGSPEEAEVRLDFRTHQATGRDLMSVTFGLGENTYGAIFHGDSTRPVALVNDGDLSCTFGGLDGSRGFSGKVSDVRVHPDLSPYSYQTACVTYVEATGSVEGFPAGRYGLVNFRPGCDAATPSLGVEVSVRGADLHPLNGGLAEKLATLAPHGYIGETVYLVLIGDMRGTRSPLVGLAEELDEAYGAAGRDNNYVAHHDFEPDDYAELLKEAPATKLTSGFELVAALRDCLFHTAGAYGEHLPSEDAAWRLALHWAERVWAHDEFVSADRLEGERLIDYEIVSSQCALTLHDRRGRAVVLQGMSMD